MMHALFSHTFMVLLVIFIFISTPSAFAQETQNKYCEAYIRVLDKKVPQEDYLKFDLIITNKQSKEETIYTRYWIEDNSGRKWSEKREDLFLNALSTRTFKREMLILPGQRAGVYFLKARIGCGFEEHELKEQFTVIEQTLAGDNQYQYREVIQLVDFPETMYLVNEREHKFNISIKNIGKVPLHNLFLDITGMPAEWYRVSTDRLDELTPGETFHFQVEIRPFNVLKNAEMTVTFNIHSDEAKMERVATIYIFNTTRSAVNYILSQILEDVEDLRQRANSLDSDSKAEVLRTLSKIKSRAEQLKDELGEDNAEDILKQARMLYDSLEVLDRMMSAEKTEKFPLGGIIKLLEGANIPIYVPVVVLSIIVSLALSAIIIRHTSEKELHLRNVKSFLSRHVPSEFPKLVHTQVKVPTSTASVQELEEEKRRVEGVLNLIESQYRQGILSDRAYRELKKRNEMKLKEIDKKLNSLLKK